MVGTVLAGMFTKFIAAIIFCAVIFGIYYAVIGIIKWFEKHKKEK